MKSAKKNGLHTTVALPRWEIEAGGPGRNVPGRAITVVIRTKHGFRAAKIIRNRAYFTREIEIPTCTTVSRKTRDGGDQYCHRLAALLQQPA